MVQLQTIVWNIHCQHEYLPIYSFELKSAFGAHELFHHLWPNDTPYSKSVTWSEHNVPSYEHNSTTFNPVHLPQYTSSQTDRQAITSLLEKVKVEHLLQRPIVGTYTCLIPSQP